MDHIKGAESPSLAAVITGKLQLAGHSIRSTADATGIPYVTLHRHLSSDGWNLKAVDLRRVAQHLGVPAGRLLDEADPQHHTQAGAA